MNKDFKYKILNPGGNKTALVIGNMYLPNEKKIINDFILKENKDVEQVGFINEKENKLEMAGGEFCVNATRCAIWEYLNKTSGMLDIEVSGCKEKIEGGMDSKGNVFAKLKINKDISSIVKPNGKFNYIELDGILQIVVNEKDSKEYIDKLKQDNEKTKLELKEIMKNVETNQNAVGIILLEKDQEKLKIYPIIWVKTIDTLFYETACGSGSLATAIYKNSIEKAENFEVIQPSGYSINVELNIIDGKIKNSIISGKVLEGNGEIKYGRI